MNFIRRQSTERGRRQRRGTEVLELALILPLLLGLTFGTIEFGYFFFLTHNVVGAAREGARTAIPFGGTEANARTKATAYLTQAGLNPANFTIEFPVSPDGAAAGTDITCYIHSTWDTCGIRLLRFISGDKIVFGKAVMRKEG